MFILTNFIANLQNSRANWTQHFNESCILTGHWIGYSSIVASSAIFWTTIVFYFIKKKFNASKMMHQKGAIQLMLVVFFSIWELKLVLDYINGVCLKGVETYQFFFQPIKQTTAFNEIFSYTPMTIISITIITTIFIMFQYFNKFFFRKEITILYILYVLLSGSQDFLSFYVILESTNMLIYYILIQNWAGNQSSSGKLNFQLEMLMKYFTINLLGSIFILLGFAFIYYSLGYFQFSSISTIFQPTWGGIDLVTGYTIPLGLITFTCGFLLKLGLAPFHFWVAPIYEKLPLALFIFLQLFAKTFFILFFLQFIAQFNLDGVGCSKPVLKFFSLIAICNISIGTIGALHQTSFKRLLIYSSLANLSLIFFVLSFSTRECVSDNSILYLVLYTTTVATLILPLFNFSSSEFNRKCSSRWSLSDFSKGLSPSLKLHTTLAILNLGGLPPFSMFFGKLIILFELIEKEAFFSSLIILIFSVVTVAYTIGILRKIWFETNGRDKVAIKNTPISLFSLSLLPQYIKLVVASKLSIIAVNGDSLRHRDLSPIRKPFEWESQILFFNLNVFDVYKLMNFILIFIFALLLYIFAVSSSAPYNRNTARGNKRSIIKMRSFTKSPSWERIFVTKNYISNINAKNKITTISTQSSLVSASGVIVSNADEHTKPKFSYDIAASRDFAVIYHEEPAYKLAEKWVEAEKAYTFIPLRWENVEQGEHFFPPAVFIGKEWFLQNYWNVDQALNPPALFRGIPESRVKFFQWLADDMEKNKLSETNPELFDSIVARFQAIERDAKDKTEAYFDEKYDITGHSTPSRKDHYLYFDVKEPFAFAPKIDLPRLVESVLYLKRKAQHAFTIENDLEGYKMLMERADKSVEALKNSWWELRIQQFLLGVDYKSGLWQELYTGLKPEDLSLMEKCDPAMLDRFNKWCHDVRLEQLANLEEYKKYYEEVARANQAVTSAKEVEELARLLPEGWDSKTSEPLWRLLGLSKKEMDALKPVDPDSYKWLETAARNKAQNIADFVNSWKDPKTKKGFAEQLSVEKRFWNKLFRFLRNDSTYSDEIVHKTLAPQHPKSFPILESSDYLLFTISGIAAACLLIVLTLLVRGFGHYPRFSSFSRNPTSPYECGFAPFKGIVSSSLILFYQLAVFFIVFEAEVIFLYPWAASMLSVSQLEILKHFFAPTAFIFALFYGYWKEIQNDALKILYKPYTTI